uniref:Uncharacterized protein n=1 Tax=Octopus bimaculoides TaxID=37653 RepID=A0A0L8GWX1_OCTBM
MYVYMYICKSLVYKTVDLSSSVTGVVTQSSWVQSMTGMHAILCLLLVFPFLGSQINHILVVTRANFLMVD